MRTVTTRQLEMLRDYADSNEATDFADFDSAGTLAWRNRERVIDALHKRKMLDADGITLLGKMTLTVAVAEGRVKLHRGQTL